MRLPSSHWSCTFTFPITGSVCFVPYGTNLIQFLRNLAAALSFFISFQPLSDSRVLFTPLSAVHLIQICFGHVLGLIPTLTSTSVLEALTAPTVMLLILPMVSVSDSSSSDSSLAILLPTFFTFTLALAVPALFSLLGPGQMGAPMKCPLCLQAWHSGHLIPGQG